MNQLLKTLIIVLLFTANDVSAQTNRYDLGIEGGPNLSFLIQKGNSYSSNRTPTTFVSTGLTFQYNCKKIFSLRTGLSYQQKGYQTASEFLYTKNTTRFDYLTVPLLARFTFGRKVNFFVNIGIFGSILLERTDQSKSDYYTKNNYQNHSKEGYSLWDAGFAGGLGIAVPIKKHWLISLEARNYCGVSDISTDSPYGHVLTNTSDLYLGVAYRLGFREENNK